MVTGWFLFSHLLRWQRSPPLHAVSIFFTNFTIYFTFNHSTVCNMQFIYLSLILRPGSNCEISINTSDDEGKLECTKSLFAFKLLFPVFIIITVVYWFCRFLCRQSSHKWRGVYTWFLLVSLHVCRRSFFYLVIFISISLLDGEMLNVSLYCIIWCC